jgi:pyruvate dehydrogenase (quinone)
MDTHGYSSLSRTVRWRTPALPQAIGAQLTYPAGQVISMSRDGGLSMLLGDLLMLRQVGLPVKAVVFNSASLGFVQLEVRAARFPDRAVDLVNPDFAKLAEAMLGVAGGQHKL